MDTLLTPTEVAQRLRVTTSTLKTWRKLRKGPPHSRIAHNQIRYPEGSLIAWLEEQKVEHGA